MLLTASKRDLCNIHDYKNYMKKIAEESIYSK